MSSKRLVQIVYKNTPYIIDLNDLEKKYGDELFADGKINTKMLSDHHTMELYKAITNTSHTNINDFFSNITQNCNINPNNDKFKTISKDQYLIEIYKFHLKMAQKKQEHIQNNKCPEA